MSDSDDVKRILAGAIRVGNIRAPLKQILLGIVDALQALTIQVQELQSIIGGKDE